MSDALDIRGILDAWPYDPENDARFARGTDGREILQVRLPLGIEQYELSGRPDGRVIADCESWFDFQQQRQSQAEAAHSGIRFGLKVNECAELFAEGQLYYLRYLRLFQMRDWRRTLRDTNRNLRLFDFVHRFAQREQDRFYLEQWRPYIMRLNTTAAAMIEWEALRHEAALELVRQCVEKIAALPELDLDTFKFEQERSVTALRELARQIKSTRPISEMERLEIALKEAVAKQAFEQAAVLRDQLRALRTKPEDSSPMSG
ncbi:MAG: UvrB/UvrC motif-containing protein [Verrucomicrobiota bacterium]